MKLPRLRIAWVMGLIAVLAFAFSAVRTLFASRSNFNDLAIAGVVPMAVILLCVLPFVMRRRDRRFLLGFEIAASVALTVYTALAVCCTDALHEGIGHILPSFLTLFRGSRGPIPVYFVASIVATTPQLVVAVLGGLCCRRYARRKTRMSSPSPFGPA